MTRDQRDCEYIFEWNLLKNNNLMHYSLKKRKQKQNEWVGIIFAKQTLKSDIVIGITSANKEPKLINGSALCLLL